MTTTVVIMPLAAIIYKSRAASAKLDFHPVINLFKGKSYIQAGKFYYIALAIVERFPENAFTPINFNSLVFTADQQIFTE